MKLLFDENLSFRLVAALGDVYPGSAHVREVGLLGAEDPAIAHDPPRADERAERALGAQGVGGGRGGLGGEARGRA